jgi:predicted DNA-binding protein
MDNTNITSVIEHLLETSEIDSAEDLQMLVDALESMPPDTKITSDNMVKIMNNIKSK